MNLLISGANGFVGKALNNTLLNHGHHISHIQRDRLSSLPSLHYDCLIHLAGRAHVMHETTNDIYQAYREVNVYYTLKIVSLAQSLGIKRFIFLSSIKVNGETSQRPLTESDAPAPLDAYGQTKLEAELLLKEFCAEHQMELVIIRPPLIYGPSVKANFKFLIKLCNRPLPLPFGRVENKRSLVSLENLNSFIELCCHHPLAANQTFMISDDYDVSTTELICNIKSALGRKPLQIPIPHAILSMALNLCGKHTLNERLLGNLQVNINKAKERIGWTPAISFEEGIKRTVKEYVG